MISHNTRKRRNFIAALFACVILWHLPGLLIPVSAEESGHEHHHRHEQALSVPEPVVDLEISEMKAGVPAIVSFLIKDQEGKPIKDLALSHERILHVIVVSRDLTVFSHIHPEDLGPITEDMKEKGLYKVRYAFPKAGGYLIAADFAISHNHFSEQFIVEIQGEPAMGAVEKDFSREKDFGEYHVQLSSVPEKIKAGQSAVLTFRIASKGKPVGDLDLYLGAPMHLAVVHADLKQFIHAHGDRPGSAAMPHGTGHIPGTVNGSHGPEIEAQVIFPVRGDYKIFGEIKHHGKVIQLNFLIAVD